VSLILDATRATTALTILTDEPVDRLPWNYLAKLGFAFAVLVAGAAIGVLVYAYMALWYLTSS
jgi:hypothetical protein